MQVTLLGYSPPPTYPPDEVLFTRARIEESSDAGVTPVIIEAAFLLEPQYVDPADPPSYNFSTNNATLEMGWYRVVFLTAGTDEAPSPWVQRIQPMTWQPTLREVGRLIYTRTKTRGGVYIGTFTDDTNPTGVEVDEMITNGVIALYDAMESARALSTRAVDPATGLIEYTPSQLNAARQLAAIYSAMQVELSRFSEQVTPDQSPYEKLKELFDEGLERLTDSIKGYDSDEMANSGEATGSVPGAVWSFPENDFPTAL